MSELRQQRLRVKEWSEFGKYPVAVAGGMFWKAAAMGQPTVEVMSVDSQ
jgi:hypothetical protein